MILEVKEKEFIPMNNSVATLTTPSMLDGSCKPEVPEEIRAIVCSKAPMKEMRAVVDKYILTNVGFVTWGLQNMFDQHTPEEKSQLTIIVKDGRGFSKFDGELLEVASVVKQRGWATEDQVAFCRKKNKKGRCRLGRYGKQLIALVMAESCRDSLTQKLAAYLPPAMLESEAA
jgi:hypothetical protein